MNLKTSMHHNDSNIIIYIQFPDIIYQLDEANSRHCRNRLKLQN